MVKIRVLALVAAILLGITPLSHATEPADPPDLGLKTNWPAQASGLLSPKVPTGALRIQPDSIDRMWLIAEEITVEMEWERGYDARGESSLATVVTERDRETIRILDAKVQFERFGDRQALFLAFTEHNPADLVLESSFLTHTAGIDIPVLQVGTPSDSVEAGEPDDPRFSYTMDGSSVQASGSANGRVDGDFTLFLHDVQIQAEGRDQDWSNWTGYQETQPSSPLTGYEFRLTSIQVTNGTFHTSIQEDVAFFSQTMEVQIEGDLFTPGANGKLLDGPDLLIFEDDAVHMEGKGILNLSSNGRELVLQPSGDFVIEGASRSQSVAPQPTGSADGSPLWPLAGASVAVIALVGFTRAGWIPVPTKASRTLRHERWMTRGSEAQAQEDLDRAAKCFGRAVRVKDDEALAWFKWASIQLDLGDPHAAEFLAVRAEDVPGMDRLDLLCIRSIAAWQREDTDLLTELLTALAAGAPLMARRLVTDLRIDRAALGPRTLAVIDQSHPEGPLDGYA